MTEVSLPNTQTYTYRYDNTYNRVQKIFADGLVRNYIGELAEAETRNGGITYLNFHFFAQGVRVATTGTNGLHYNTHDHLGSTTAITSKAGVIEQKLDYLPFGAERVNQKTTAFDSHFTYTDQEKDAESGLLYYGARYYDPVIGRFTQMDPVVKDPTRKEFQVALANPQLLNGYSYVANNPLKYVDEEGEFLAALLELLPSIVSAVTLMAPMIPAIFENSALAGQMTIRTVPFYGDAIDITEAVTGRDVFSGQQVGGLERGATIVGAAIPFIPNQVARSITKTQAAQAVVRMLNDIRINKVIRQVEAGADYIKVGSREDAISAGMKFVGDNPERIFKDGSPMGWKSSDGLRIFREPAIKQSGIRAGQEAANLEIKSSIKGGREINTHLTW